MSLFPEFDKRYPLNLSILLSGGTETNRDTPISGERKGYGPKCETAPAVLCILTSAVCLLSLIGLNTIPRKVIVL